MQGIEHTYYEDCQVQSSHSTTIIHHCPPTWSPIVHCLFLAFTSLQRTLRHQIEIKSTFNTGSRELKIRDVEIGYHSKSWCNISDLLKHKNVTHLRNILMLLTPMHLVYKIFWNVHSSFDLCNVKASRLT